MAIINELSGPQIAECLDEAARRKTPVTITCRTGEDIRTLRSRILRSEPRGILLAMPEAPDGLAEVAAGDRLGVAFKLKHHKHLFNAVVEAVEEALPGADRTVRLPAPNQMHRIQRRAYERAEVPRNRSVLTTMWMGGLWPDRSDPAAGAPTWEGWMTNLSAGGFQVRLSLRTVPELEPGDVVGVRIELGQEFTPVLADAQFRQQVVDDRGVTLVGFQFIGLNDSPAGRETLGRIARVVHEFHRVQNRRRACAPPRHGPWRGTVPVTDRTE